MIDYIGNHRVFLNKPPALLAAFGRLTRTRAEVPRTLRSQDFSLPPGCSVTYDVEALEILERLCPPSKGVTAIREWHEDFKEANERRPTALEAYHSGALACSREGEPRTWPSRSSRRAAIRE